MSWLCLGSRFNYFYMNWIFNLFDYRRTLGSVRSPQWQAVSRAYRKEQPLCEFGMHKPTLLNPLNTHHVVAFHNDKTLELVKSNWINVCRFHHYAHCHFFNWSDTNSNVRTDAKTFTDELNAHRVLAKQPQV